MLRLLFPLLLVACSDGAPANAPADGGESAGAPEVRLVEVASGLDDPVHLTAPAGDDRLFVVEQPGRIRIIRDGRVLERPFLDLSGKISAGGEQGLLGLAFHPRYAENGRFYVNYTDNEGDTRVERYTVSSDPDVADPASAAPVLRVEQPYRNHNGGLVLFGPDGMLYIGLGDGGAGGDPHGNGQNTGTLLGSILRIDVDAGEAYAVPSDNPFVGRPDARPEIWAYGLRNPWRFSFDAETGLLYVADVGQNRLEEVNVEPAEAGGLNYGWDIMEGSDCFSDDACDPAGLVLPVLEYTHDEGCSITGGPVYRGESMPALQGHYLYADWCEGWIRSFRYEDGRATQRTTLAEDVGRITSFGRDAAGEVYVLTGGGAVYRVQPR